VRNKSRLVAQGFSQKEGIDYEETFAPIARLEAIRILLAFSVAKGFKLHKMDAKSAFLNGVLEVLTPKFGKESDLWVRYDKESVWRKEGSFQRCSAKRSAVGYLLQFGKGTVELFLRD
jgi:hypothetical protein